MKIRIEGYPLTCEFEIPEESLPAFEYGCKVRTDIVHKHLETVAFDAPHSPEDFIVERVRKFKRGGKSCESWFLGS